MAFSFFSLGPDGTGWQVVADLIHGHAESGALFEGLDFESSPLLVGAYEFFDTEQVGTLSMKDVGLGISRLSSRDDDSAYQFMFILTDADCNGSLSSGEVVGFCRSFTEIYTHLAKFAAETEEAQLLASGFVSPGELRKRKYDLDEAARNTEITIAEDSHRMFHVFDMNKDGRIDAAEFMAHKTSMPRTTYSTLLMLLDSLLRNDMHHFRLRPQVDVEDLALHDLGLPQRTEAHLKAAIYKHGNAHGDVTRQVFPALLMELIAPYFFAAESRGHAEGCLRQWVTSGALYKDIDCTGTFFDRIFNYVDNEEVGLLSMYSFGAAAQRIAFSSAEEKYAFMYALTCRDRNQTHVGQADLSDFLGACGTVMAQLAYNVSMLERPWLLQIGVDPATLQSHSEALKLDVEMASSTAKYESRICFEKLASEGSLGKAGTTHAGLLSQQDWLSGTYSLPRFYDAVPKIIGAALEGSAVKSVMRPSFAVADCVVPGLSGLGFTDPEAQDLLALFHPFATDGYVETVDQFADLLIQSFAMNLLPEDGIVHGMERMELWCREGSLKAGIDPKASLFARAYAFFDVDEDEMLTLFEYGAGLAKVRSSPKAAQAFVFYLTDIDNDGAITMGEMRALYEEVVCTLSALSCNLAGLQQEFLTKATGVWPEEIRAFIADKLREEELAEEKAAVEVSQLFPHIDSDSDNQITFDEFTVAADNKRLPDMYDTLLDLLLAVVQPMREDLRARYKTKEDRTRMTQHADEVGPAMKLLGFKDGQILHLVKLFDLYSSDGVLTQDDFMNFLLHGWACAFTAAETKESSYFHIESWVQSGRLNRGIEMFSRNSLFKRTFLFFANGKEEVTIDDIVAGYKKMDLRSHNIHKWSEDSTGFLDFAFFLTDFDTVKKKEKADDEPKDDEEEGDEEAYTSDNLLQDENIQDFVTLFITAFTRLGLNVLACEQDELIKQGVKLSSVHLHASRLLQLQYNLTDYVHAVTKEIFRNLDSDLSGIIGLDEWRVGNLNLPRAYNKLRIMMSVMANPNIEGFRPCFSNSDSASSTSDFSDPLWTCFFTQAQLEKLMIERVVEARGEDSADPLDDECLCTWENFKGCPAVWVPTSVVLQQGPPSSGRSTQSLWDEYTARTKFHQLRSLAGDQAARRAERRFLAAKMDPNLAVNAASLLQAAAAHLFENEFGPKLEGKRKATAWVSPGSIQMAGRDCDYQGGKVTAFGINRCVGLVCLPREDTGVRIFAAETPKALHSPLVSTHKGTREAKMLGMIPNAAYWKSSKGELNIPDGWDRPIIAVSNHMVKKFLHKNLKGADICIASNIPEGSSCHSAEAIAVAATLAFAEVNGLRDHEMFTQGVPLAEFVAQSLAEYDKTRGYFWYDDQDAFGLCNAGAMASGGAHFTGEICEYDHGTKYHDSETRRAPLPEGYSLVVAACGNEGKGTDTANMSRAMARAAHVAWCSGARRQEERNLAEAHEMGLTSSTMAKAVRYHFRGGGQDRDPIPGQNPLTSHPIQNKMGVQGKIFTSEELVDRVLDFGAEQQASQDMLDAFLNLGIDQGSGEERAIYEVAAGCLDRCKVTLEKDGCPEIIFLIQEAKKHGAIAAGPAGHGAVWALLKSGSLKDDMAFEAAWRHAHTSKFDVPCDMFATVPTCGGMECQRGNYFD